MRLIIIGPLIPAPPSSPRLSLGAPGIPGIPGIGVGAGFIDVDTGGAAAPIGLEYGTRPGAPPPSPGLVPCPPHGGNGVDAFGPPGPWLPILAVNICEMLPGAVGPPGDWFVIGGGAPIGPALLPPGIMPCIGSSGCIPPPIGVGGIGSMRPACGPIGMGGAPSPLATAPEGGRNGLRIAIRYDPRRSSRRLSGTPQAEESVCRADPVGCR